MLARANNVARKGLLISIVQYFSRISVFEEHQALTIDPGDKPSSLEVRTTVNGGAEKKTFDV